MNTINDVKDVLIVGAGPTGLALGIDLRRRGISVKVVEQSQQLFPGSRGKGIQPRTLEVLEDLGVIKAILAAGGPPPVPMVWQDGERKGERPMTDEAEPSAGVPYPGLQLVPQWRTQEILYDRLVELGGSVTFGTALTGLAQDTEGVIAQLSGGGITGTAESSTVRARYLVAGDGGRSTVRRLLGIEMTGETVDPTPILVADLRIPALDRLNWHMFPGENGSFTMLCPLPGTDHFQLAASLDTHASPDTTPAGVQALIAARTHLAPEDVTEVLWASDFRPCAALADRFRDGGIFLAGDAAHIHSPAGAQGLNTSIQDAYNLGWKLAQVLLHGAPETLLDTYEGERRPNAEQMLGLSTRIHRGEQQRGAATRQLDLGYRDSPLSTGEAGTLQAGDRAPDGRLPDGTRIFDALQGVHFTLLLAGADAIAPLNETDRLHVHHLDANTPYGEGLFLIRPDGYVGWASRDATGLTQWLRAVGDLDRVRPCIESGS